MSNTFVENYEILSDEEIVSLINGGSIELLQVIIDRYLPKILFFVKRTVPNPKWRTPYRRLHTHSTLR